MFLCNKAIIKAWETVESLRSLKLSWPVHMYTLSSSILAHVMPWLPQSQHRRGGSREPRNSLSLPSQIILSRDHYLKGAWLFLGRLEQTCSYPRKIANNSPSQSRLGSWWGEVGLQNQGQLTYRQWKKSLPNNCFCVLWAVSWGFLPFLQGVLVSPVLWGSSEVTMPALIPTWQWPCHAQTTAFCNT